MDEVGGGVDAEEVESDKSVIQQPKFLYQKSEVFAWMYQKSEVFVSEE
jgi:hypothetical protein